VPVEEEEELPSYMVQLQEKHKWPSAKSGHFGCSICSSVDHLGHHKMQALPFHFKWIHCIFTANGAEENNMKYEQSKI